MSRKATRPLLLTFDAFGTLFAPKEPIERQYCEVARTFGFSLQETDIKASFRKAFKATSTAHPLYGLHTLPSPKTWWSLVITSTFTPLLPPHTPLPADLVPTLYARFSSAAGYSLFPDVPPLLRRIRGGTAWPSPLTMLGVVSNSDPRVRGVLEALGVSFAKEAYPAVGAENAAGAETAEMAALAFMTLSYEIGAEKPASEIYEAAFAAGAKRALQEVKRAHGELERALEDVAGWRRMHVGDDLALDVVPALQMGVEGVLLDRDNGVKESEEKQMLVKEWNVPVIRDLSELACLIREDYIMLPMP